MVTWSYGLTYQPTDKLAHLLGYQVTWSPGVRVRQRPSIDAPVIGCLRSGARFTATPSDVAGWVSLDEGAGTPNHNHNHNHNAITITPLL